MRTKKLALAYVAIVGLKEIVMDMLLHIITSNSVMSTRLFASSIQ